MHDYAELTLAREDMKAQSELYRCTAFWDEVSSHIVSKLATLTTHNAKTFRSLRIADLDSSTGSTSRQISAFSGAVFERRNIHFGGLPRAIGGG